MEPTIYKPSIYNGKAVYNGNSVYNGNGVYNDGKGFNYGSVIVDGEEYKTLEYNGRIWTVENIRNNISTNYDVEPYGRLYKYSDAVNGIESKLSDGWRIPTLNDFQDLITLLGSDDPLKWISKNFSGKNKNGFDIPLCGYVNTYNNYLNNGVRCYIWTKTTYSTNNKYNFYCGYTGLGVDDYANAGNSDKTKLSVRICKDL